MSRAAFAQLVCSKSWGTMAAFMARLAHVVRRGAPHGAVTAEPSTGSVLPGYANKRCATASSYAIMHHH
jgi:hypothetical protein